jgi:AcrR family transcriptional regulator
MNSKVETAWQVTTEPSRAIRRRLKPGPRPKTVKKTAVHTGAVLKEKILTVAINLFAERGFADTRISDIADRAGAEAPTIYYYFGDKKSLYRTACRTCFVRGVREALMHAREDTQPEVRLYQHVLGSCHVLIGNRPFYMLIQRQLLELRGKEMRAFLEGSFELAFKEVCQIVGALKTEQDPVTMAVYVFSLIFGTTRLSAIWDTVPQINFPEARSPEKLARAIVELLFPQIDWARFAT